MASKKYTLLLGALTLFASGVFAQVGGSYNVSDSSVVPTKRLPQHNEFLRGDYPFPAKPRNQWEIGIKGGVPTISGDIPAVIPTFGFGAHVRKAFGYVFSLRAEYINGTAKGLHWLISHNYGKNPAWNGASNPGRAYKSAYRDYITGQGRPGPLDNVFYNYKTKLQDLSLQGVVTLNNLRFHKSKTGINFYGFAGIGATAFNVSVNALDASGNTYASKWNTITSADHANRKDKKKEVKATLDDTYETPYTVDRSRRSKFGDNTLMGTGTVGVGVAIKLSKRFNIALENRHTFIKTDQLDAQQWQEHAYGDAVHTRDFDSYNFFSLGINANLGAKSVEPLWWLNPMDFAYNELRNPRFMKLPKPQLPDGDGDGVTDQFDNEPNTPQNCPVDSHGVSKDTDGDGVPDCKDKELITPTQCQPVDADGIGKCPDPKCCTDRPPVPQGCAIGDLPSVMFAKGSTRLSDDAKAALSAVASKMRSNANCNVAVIGYCSSDKKQQQQSWDRVNAVINYLVEKEGISSGRFIFKYGEEGGDCETVDLRDGSGMEGPNTVPAPHPNLRRN